MVSMRSRSRRHSAEHRVPRNVLARGALTLFAVASLAATLVACAPAEPAEGALLASDGGALYTDGTYIAAYSHTGSDGWQPHLKARIRAGLITNVTFGAVDAEGVSLADDGIYAERFRMATGMTPADLTDALDRALLDRQQLPVLLPTTGPNEVLAWETAFAVLADAALGAARAGTPSTVVVPTPGPYRVTDRPDELGWQAELTVIFDGDRIAAARFVERRRGADGTVTRKSDDEEYSAVYDRLLGLTPAGVARDLAAQFVTAGKEAAEGESVALDGISGATGTTARFQALADRLMAGRVAVRLPGKL